VVRFLSRLRLRFAIARSGFFFWLLLRVLFRDRDRVRFNFLLGLWLGLRQPLRLIGQDVTRLVRTGWQRNSGYEIETDSIAAATSAPSFTAMAARNGC